MSNSNSSAVIKAQQTSVTDFSHLRDKVQQLIEASTASETRRIYSCQLNKFFTWCNSTGIQYSLPVKSENLRLHRANGRK